MKKLALLSVVAALIFSSCNFTGNSDREKQVRDSLRNELNLKEKENDELIELISIVTDGFRQIDEAEGRISINPDREYMMSQKDVIEEQMNFIVGKMSENREKIEKLEKMMKSSKAGNAKLQTMIANLKSQLEAKEAHIAELNSELESKNIHINLLDSTITRKNAAIDELTEQNEKKAKLVDAQDKMINRAWYVYGTRKELKNHRILDGSEVLKNSDFDREYFTEVDIREFRELPLYSKRISLETSHPEGSYELVKDEKGQYILRITNPELFWNVSRYLVILVK